MLKERDANSDGKLSGDELSERLLQRLNEADTDKDGAMSASELEASFRSGGPGRRGGGQSSN